MAERRIYVMSDGHVTGVVGDEVADKCDIAGAVSIDTPEVSGGC